MIEMTLWFSTQTIEAENNGINIFKLLRKKIYQFRILFSVKIFFMVRGK